MVYYDKYIITEKSGTRLVNTKIMACVIENIPWEKDTT